MKKILKITGIILGILLLFLILAPFLFKGSLEKLLIKNINENLNATVAWEDFNLSFFSSFPNAALVINNFSVINKVPFEGDTLVSGEKLKLNLGITQLFKGSDQPIAIDAIILNSAKVNVKIDSSGHANYDIALKENTSKNQESTSETATGFSFNLKRYEINKTQISYQDEASKTLLTLSEFNHFGKGDFSADNTDLDTQTKTMIHYKIGDDVYIKETTLALDALFNLDLANKKYTFLENEAKINELAIAFDGFVKMNENNNEIDLTFKTPSTDFKNFLAIVPKKYVKDLNGVSTTGNFSIEGIVKGMLDEERIPTMDIKVRSNNASFKYPDLPKEVTNISINADIVNASGYMKDTYLTIGGVTFKIDDQLFNASVSIKNFTENMLVNLALNGTLNLANITKVFPVEMDQKLTGIFTADLVTNFDMQSIEKEQYQNIQTNGTAGLTGFSYSDPAFKNPIAISKASIAMNPSTITLKELQATTGSTDINAQGTIENLIPWVMAKQDLKGRFTIDSDTFNLNDFMSESEEKTKETTQKQTSNTTETTSVNETLKIPDFLDASIDFQAKKVIYDDITLGYTTGSVSIKDETAGLKNVTSSVFGGKIIVDGSVSTKTEVPTFAMGLDLNKINIDESFEKLGLLKFLAPIAKALQGDMNTKFNINGNLNNDLTPDLKTLAGDAFAQILTAEVNTEQAPLLSAIGGKLDFLNLDKLSLRDIATNVTFINGSINVQPFDFDIEGIKVTAGGSHGLNQNINYNLIMDVPAKFLGSEVTSLLSKIDPAEANKMSVSMPIELTGTFTKPRVNLNTKAAVTQLTQQIIAKQKNNLINEGTNALQDLLGGGNNTGNATNNPTGGDVGGIIKDILKPKDETPKNGGNTTNTTETIKDVLGGLLGGKKKKQKDSLKGGY